MYAVVSKTMIDGIGSCEVEKYQFMFDDAYVATITTADGIKFLVERAKSIEDAIRDVTDLAHSFDAALPATDVLVQTDCGRKVDNIPFLGGLGGVDYNYTIGAEFNTITGWEGMSAAQVRQTFNQKPFNYCKGIRGFMASSIHICIGRNQRIKFKVPMVESDPK